MISDPAREARVLQQFCVGKRVASIKIDGTRLRIKFTDGSYAEVKSETEIEFVEVRPAE
jgi:hypothetical protein